MDHKLSKAQIEAKTYVDTHNLEKIIGDMLNSLVYAKDPYPTVFMIKYLASLATPEELSENGIKIESFTEQKLPAESKLPTESKPAEKSLEKELENKSSQSENQIIEKN